jgi:hypothetical protein
VGMARGDVREHGRRHGDTAARRHGGAAGGGTAARRRGGRRRREWARRRAAGLSVPGRKGVCARARRRRVVRGTPIGARTKAFITAFSLKHAGHPEGGETIGAPAASDLDGSEQATSLGSGQ